MSRHVFDIVKKFGEQKNYDVSYTPEDVVKTLMELVPFSTNDIVLDAGSGINKVWFNNIPSNCIAEQCEITEGGDFLKYEGRVDWVIGNPPYSLLFDFAFKASEICNKGFCFLINHNRWNGLTPARLNRLENAGFYLSNVKILAIQKWFGRYYFIQFTKNKSNDIGYIYGSKK